MIRRCITGLWLLLITLTISASVLDRSEQVVDDSVLRMNLITGASTAIQGSASEALELANEALARGDTREARRQLATLKLDAPDHPATQEVDGTISLLEGKASDAIGPLQQAALLAPAVPEIRAKLAVALLQAGETRAARETLDTALKLDPSSVIAQHLMARIARSDGRINDAINHQRIAVFAEPDFGPMRAYLVDLMLANGQVDDARRELEKADQESDDEELALLRARTSLLQGDTRQALTYLESAAQNGADKDLVTFYRAAVMIESGDNARAEADLRRLVEKYPHRPLLFEQLIGILVLQGKQTEINRAIQRELDTPELPVSMRVALSRIAVSAGEADLGMAAIEALLNGDSASAGVLFTYARAGIIAGQLTKADAVTARLVTDYPDFSPGYLLRAEVEVRQDAIEQALSTMKAASTKFPGDVSVWQSRVAMMLRLERYEKAIDVIGEALRIHPNDVQLRLQLANAQQLSNRTAVAEATYKSLLSNERARLVSLNNLANIAAREPARYAEALNYSRQAYELAPGSPAILDTYGWLLHLNGRSAEALESLSLAHNAAPNDPETLCHYGIVVASVNGPEKVRPELQRCINSTSDSALSEAARNLL